MSNTESKIMQSEQYYVFDLPDEMVREKVKRMKPGAVNKNYGMIKLPSLTLSLLGLRECK